MHFHIQDVLIGNCGYQIYYDATLGFKAVELNEGKEIALILPFNPNFVPTQDQLHKMRISFSQYSRKVADDMSFLILGLQLKGGGCLFSKESEPSTPVSRDANEARKSSPLGNTRYERLGGTPTASPKQIPGNPNPKKAEGPKSL